MHFIRAFPIVLILILVIALVPVFADSDPYWLQGSSPILVTDQTYILSSNHNYYFSSISDIPVYLYGLSLDSQSLNNIIAISYYPTSVSYVSNGNESIFNLSNSIIVNGIKYYFAGTAVPIADFAPPIVVADSIANSISFAFNSSGVESTNIIFNITRLIFASSNWLSSIVRTVMANPLLIFILLFYFCGTAIGLLFRFRRN